MSTFFESWNHLRRINTGTIKSYNSTIVFGAKKNILRFWGPNLPLCQFGVGHQRVKLKRFHFFPESFRFFLVCFRCFSGLFPESFRKKVGKTQAEERAETFPKKAESFKFRCQKLGLGAKTFPTEWISKRPLTAKFKRFCSDSEVLNNSLRN